MGNLFCFVFRQPFFLVSSLFVPVALVIVRELFIIFPPSSLLSFFFLLLILAHVLHSARKFYVKKMLLKKKRRMWTLWESVPKCRRTPRVFSVIGLSKTIKIKCKKIFKKRKEKGKLDCEPFRAPQPVCAVGFFARERGNNSWKAFRDEDAGLVASRWKRPREGIAEKHCSNHQVAGKNNIKKEAGMEFQHRCIRVRRHFWFRIATRRSERYDYTLPLKAGVAKFNSLCVNNGRNPTEMPYWRVLCKWMAGMQC